MILRKNNYEQKINSFTKEDWKPLSDLIPVIENTQKFSTKRGSEIDEDGVMSMPFNEPSPVITEFLEIVYNMPIVIDFDWAGWEEGKKMIRDDFDYDTIDIPTKCKLITAIVRNDRFREGALESALESGVILKILKSIERQLH